MSHRGSCIALHQRTSSVVKRVAFVCHLHASLQDVSGGCVHLHRSTQFLDKIAPFILIHSNLLNTHALHSFHSFTPAQLKSLPFFPPKKNSRCLLRILPLCHIAFPSLSYGHSCLTESISLFFILNRKGSVKLKSSPSCTLHKKEPVNVVLVEKRPVSTHTDADIDTHTHRHTHTHIHTQHTHTHKLRNLNKSETSSEIGSDVSYRTKNLSIRIKTITSNVWNRSNHSK